MKVFLDSTAVIYYFEGTHQQQQAVRQVLAKLGAAYGVLTMVVSRLTVMACLVKPLRERNEALVNVYQAYFAHVNIIELTADCVASATTLRALNGLKTPDALLAGCALSADVPLVFVTADAGFSRVSQLHIETIAL